MKSHNLHAGYGSEIVSQAQHGIDVTKDYDLVLKVRGGVVHSYAHNTSAKIKPCIECERYEAFMSVVKQRQLMEEGLGTHEV